MFKSITFLSLTALCVTVLTLTGAHTAQTTWLNIGITPISHSCGKC